MTIADIASLIVALATTGSLLYISRQVNVARRQAKGQFLLALDAQFEKFNNMTVRLVNEPGFTPDGKDWYEIWGLMSVFERINIMCEDKILDIALIDRLHGFRLRSIIRNESIYQRLGATGSEWQDFIDLCYALADYYEQQTEPAHHKTFIERVRKLDKTSYKNDAFRF
jgi:hypothetical protein